MRLTILPLILLASVACRSSNGGSDAMPEPEQSFEPASAEPEIATPNEAGAPTAAAGGAQDMQSEVQDVQRRREQRRFLAQEYIQRGNDELSRADLHAALDSFAAAWEIDPNNQEAREGLQTGVVTKQLVSRTPSPHNRSILGVRASA